MRRFVIATLCLLAMSCDNSNLFRVPHTVAYLKLNIYTTGMSLAAVPSHKSISTLNEAYDADTRLGYGGLLIVNGIDGIMRAYDLACPVEASRTTRIVVDETHMYATCPKCKSKFCVGDIDASGSPVEGIAREQRYFLRRYNVSPVQSDGHFFVTN